MTLKTAAAIIFNDYAGRDILPIDYCTYCGEACEVDSREFCLESGRREYFSLCCQSGYQRHKMVFGCATCDNSFDTRAERDECKHSELIEEELRS